MGLSKDRHGTYYAIKKVPAQLQEAVADLLDNGKQRQVWLKRSLGTKDHTEAKRRIKAVQIEFDRTLERAKDLLAERPMRDGLSEAEIKRMAEYHFAEMLYVDEGKTREGTGRDALMKSIASQLDAAGVEYTMGVPFSENPPEHGLSDADVLRRQADLDFEIPILKVALATGDISQVKESLDYLLAIFGINLDRRSEAYRRLGMAVLRKEVAALEAIQQRAHGQPIETPPLPAIGANPTPGGETLTAAFDGWKRQRERAPGTLSEYERAIRLFVELHGDLPVVQIRKNHARQFREALQDVPQRRTGKLLKALLPEVAQWGREHPSAQKITAGTVNKLLGGVQAVAVWARDNGMVPDDVPWADPFAKMRLGEGEAVRGGAPFELSDLQAIFRTPVFTAEERPKGGRGEAAFWLPLLALFAGVRLSEGAGLRAADVGHNQLIGAPCIYIRADRKAGKTLKTKASERIIPVHPQLIALGFLDYVAAQSKAHGSNTWLFPKVAPGTKGAAAFSKWFGRYIGARGVTDETKVFHSFRHNFVDALRVGDVSEEINRALVGHGRGGVHGGYGAKDVAARYRHRLAEAVGRVKYTGLDLSHLGR
jgi:integrase